MCLTLVACDGGGMLNAPLGVRQLGRSLISAVLCWCCARMQRLPSLCGPVRLWPAYAGARTMSLCLEWHLFVLCATLLSTLLNFILEDGLRSCAYWQFADWLLK